jgi:hypothetical protein
MNKTINPTTENRYSINTAFDSPSGPKLPPTARNVPCALNLNTVREDFPDLRSEDVPLIGLSKHLLGVKGQKIVQYRKSHAPLSSTSRKSNNVDFERLYYEENLRAKDLETKLKKLKLTFETIFEEKQAMQNNYEAFIADMQLEHKGFRILEFKLRNAEDHCRLLEEEARKLCLQNRLLIEREEASNSNIFNELKNNVRIHNEENLQNLAKICAYQSEIQDLSAKLNEFKTQNEIEKINFIRIIENFNKENEDLKRFSFISTKDKEKNTGQRLDSHLSQITEISELSVILSKNQTIANQSDYEVQQIVNREANLKDEYSMNGSTIDPSFDSVNYPINSQISKLKVGSLHDKIDSRIAPVIKPRKEAQTHKILCQNFSDIYSSNEQDNLNEVKQISTRDSKEHFQSPVVNCESIRNTMLQPNGNHMPLEGGSALMQSQSENKVNKLVTDSSTEKSNQHQALDSKPHENTQYFFNGIAFMKKAKDKYEECMSIDLSDNDNKLNIPRTNPIFTMREKSVFASGKDVNEALFKRI